MELPKIETAEDMEFVERVLKAHGDKVKGDRKIRKAPKRKVDAVQAEELSSLLDIELLRAEQARRSLAKFIEYGWHVLEPQNPFVGNWHIDVISEHLEGLAIGHIQNLLINVPPRHSKSLIATVGFPAWVWASWPHLRFIYAGYALSLSRFHSTLCRNLIASTWYQRSFGHVYQMTSDNIGEITNDKTGYRLVTSVGASVIGRGGDIVAVDDPHDPREGSQKTTGIGREGVLTWYDNVMSTRFEGDPKKGRRLIIMQRIHDKDLSGHVLEQANWTHLNLPMEYVPSKKCVILATGFEDPRKKAGDLLNPNRFDQKWVDFQSGSNKTGLNPKNTRKMSSSAWSGQFQQDPVPEGGSIIKLKWLEDNYYREKPESIYAQSQKVIATFDMSFKDRSTSDFTVGCVWGKIGVNIYLIDMIRARMAFVETRAAVKQLLAEYPRIDEKIVEDRANGPPIYDELKRAFPGFIAKDPGTKSKEERLEAVSWIFESGNVKVPDPKMYPWAQVVVDEVTRFPASEFDDIVDNFTMAVSRLKTIVVDPKMIPIGVGLIEGRDRQWGYEPSPTLNDRSSPFTRNWGY